MQSTALAVQTTGALARIGSGAERQYLMEVMAEQLGIPSRDAARPEVVAILANAAQRNIQYGWMPGIHMHIQKFETRESREARKRNPSLTAVYTYTLVDGEKAWKDSGARWRTEYGVHWRYQRKVMSQPELMEEARLMGMTPKDLANNATGVWCRVIIQDEDDPNDPDNPMWSAGVYTGKVKAGNYWHDDGLPTGVTAKDVAIWRADKRAMMQSGLALLPVDNRSEEERSESLRRQLLAQQAVRDRDTALPANRTPPREEDGDILFAAPPPTRPRRLAAPDDASETFDPPEAAEGVFYEVIEENIPDPAPQTQMEALETATDDFGDGARRDDGGKCPECFAPAGKPHGSRCSRREGAPAPAVAAQSLPGIEQDELFMEEEFNPYAALLHNPDIRLPADVVGTIHHVRAQHEETAIMTPKAYGILVGKIEAILGSKGEKVHGPLLACLCGSKIDRTRRPGEGVLEMGRWLDDPNRYLKQVESLRKLVAACRMVAEEMGEEEMEVA